MDIQSKGEMKGRRKEQTEIEEGRGGEERCGQGERRKKEKRQGEKVEKAINLCETVFGPEPLDDLPVCPRLQPTPAGIRASSGTDLASPCQIWA